MGLLTGCLTGFLIVSSPWMRGVNGVSTVFWAVFGVTAALYAQTSLKDPGFLRSAEPSTPHAPQTDNIRQSSFTVKPYTQLHDCSEPQQVPQHNSEATQNYSGAVLENQPEDQSPLKDEDVQMREVRYCIVCQLEQPVRCKHCSKCGKCVTLHDHHCPWMGTCVGEKNRFWFYWYLLFQSALL